MPSDSLSGTRCRESQVKLTFRGDANKNFNVDALGSTSANLKTLGHIHCERPMYPLDKNVKFIPNIELF